MSRPAPATITPIPVDRIASNRAIQIGQASAPAEEVLMENIQYLHCNMRPPIVRTIFRPDTTTPYLVAGTTSHVIHAGWARAPFVDFTHWDATAMVENTSGSHAAEIRFTIQSSGTTATITVPASTSAWTALAIPFYIAYDPTETVDTITMEIKNGASGALRVHAVAIRPAPLTTVTAGKSTGGYVALDTDEIGADEPLTTYIRQRMADNLEALRKTRVQTIVGWSEGFTRATTSQFSEISSSYVTQAIIPFQSGYGQTSIRWALHGRRLGSIGTVKLEVYQGDTMQDSEEISLQTTWASGDSPPYSAALHDYTGGAAVACIANKPGHIKVSLKGDGSAAALMFSLCCWFADGS